MRMRRARVPQFLGRRPIGRRRHGAQKADKSVAIARARSLRDEEGEPRADDGVEQRGARGAMVPESLSAARSWVAGPERTAVTAGAARRDRRQHRVQPDSELACADARQLASTHGGAS